MPRRAAAAPTIPGWRSAPRPAWSASGRTRCGAGRTAGKIESYTDARRSSPLPALQPGGDGQCPAPPPLRRQRLTGSAGTISGEIHRRMQRGGLAGQPWQARLSAAQRDEFRRWGQRTFQLVIEYVSATRRAERELLLGEAEKMGALYGAEASARRPVTGRGGRGLPLLPLAGAGGDRRSPAPPSGGYLGCDRRRTARRPRRSTRCWLRWSARTASGSRTAQSTR